MTVRGTATVSNKYGIHARPAMQLVDLANQFACKISVGKVSSLGDDFTVDAKSIMSVMRLALRSGSEMGITCDGPDEEQALAAIQELLRSGFGELEGDGGTTL